jgi:hypothetical protein
MRPRPIQLLPKRNEPNHWRFEFKRFRSNSVRIQEPKSAPATLRRIVFSQCGGEIGTIGIPVMVGTIGIPAGATVVGVTVVGPTGTTGIIGTTGATSSRRYLWLGSANFWTIEGHS